MPLPIPAPIAGGLPSGTGTTAATSPAKGVGPTDILNGTSEKSKDDIKLPEKGYPRVFGTYATQYVNDSERVRDDGISVIDIVPDARIFIFGVEVSKDVLQLTINNSDKESGSCQIKLANPKGKYEISRQDMMGMWREDKDILASYHYGWLERQKALGLEPWKVAETVLGPEISSLAKDAVSVGSGIVDAYKKSKDKRAYAVPDAAPTRMIFEVKRASGIDKKIGDIIFDYRDPVQVFLKGRFTPFWYFGFSGIVTRWDDNDQYGTEQSITLKCNDVLHLLKMKKFSKGGALYSAANLETSLVNNDKERSTTFYKDIETESTLSQLVKGLIYGVDDRGRVSNLYPGDIITKKYKQDKSAGATEHGVLRNIFQREVGMGKSEGFMFTYDKQPGTLGARWNPSKYKFSIQDDATVDPKIEHEIPFLLDQGANNEDINKGKYSDWLPLYMQYNEIYLESFTGTNIKDAYNMTVRYWEVDHDINNTKDDANNLYNWKDTYAFGVAGTHPAMLYNFINNFEVLPRIWRLLYEKPEVIDRLGITPTDKIREIVIGNGRERTDVKLGNSATHTNYFRPRLFVLIPKKYKDRVIGANGFREFQLFKEDTTTTYQVLKQVVDKIEYRMFVSPMGDIFIEPSMHDFHPLDFWENIEEKGIVKQNKKVPITFKYAGRDEVNDAYKCDREDFAYFYDTQANHPFFIMEKDRLGITQSFKPEMIFTSTRVIGSVTGDGGIAESPFQTSEGKDLLTDVSYLNMGNEKIEKSIGRGSPYLIGIYIADGFPNSLRKKSNSSIVKQDLKRRQEILDNKIKSIIVTKLLLDDKNFTMDTLIEKSSAITKPIVENSVYYDTEIDLEKIRIWGAKGIKVVEEVRKNYGDKKGDLEKNEKLIAQTEIEIEQLESIIEDLEFELARIDSLYIEGNAISDAQYKQDKTDYTIELQTREEQLFNKEAQLEALTKANDLDSGNGDFTNYTILLYENLTTKFKEILNQGNKATMSSNDNQRGAALTPEDEAYHDNIRKLQEEAYYKFLSTTVKDKLGTGSPAILNDRNMESSEGLAAIQKKLESLTPEGRAEFNDIVELYTPYALFTDLDLQNLARERIALEDSAELQFNKIMTLADFKKFAQVGLYNPHLDMMRKYGYRKAPDNNNLFINNGIEAFQYAQTYFNKLYGQALEYKITMLARPEIFINRPYYCERKDAIGLNLNYSLSYSVGSFFQMTTNLNYIRQNALTFNYTLGDLDEVKKYTPITKDVTYASQGLFSGISLKADFIKDVSEYSPNKYFAMEGQKYYAEKYGLSFTNIISKTAGVVGQVAVGGALGAASGSGVVGAIAGELARETSENVVRHFLERGNPKGGLYSAHDWIGHINFDDTQPLCEEIDTNIKCFENLGTNAIDTMAEICDKLYDKFIKLTTLEKSMDSFLGRLGETEVAIDTETKAYDALKKSSDAKRSDKLIKIEKKLAGLNANKKNTKTTLDTYHDRHKIISLEIYGKTYFKDGIDSYHTDPNGGERVPNKDLFFKTFDKNLSPNSLFYKLLRAADGIKSFKNEAVYKCIDDRTVTNRTQLGKHKVFLYLTPYNEDNCVDLEGKAEEFSNQIQFSLGKHDVTGDKVHGSANTAVLENLASFMEEHPTLSVVVEGHTGSGREPYSQEAVEFYRKDPTHTYTYHLSMRRVDSVFNYLISKGIAPGRVDAGKLPVGNEKIHVENVTKEVKGGFIVRGVRNLNRAGGDFTFMRGAIADGNIRGGGWGYKHYLIKDTADKLNPENRRVIFVVYDPENIIDTLDPFYKDGKPVRLFKK